MNTDQTGLPRRVLERLAQLAARCRDKRDQTTRDALLQLADDCAPHYPAVAEEALAILSRDSDPATGDAVTLGLQNLLALMDGLAGMRLSIDWATGLDGDQRLAMSRALASERPLLGAVPLLDVLAHDARADVREAACISCGARSGTSPAALAKILAMSASDPDAAVRFAALAGLEVGAGGLIPGYALSALRDCAGSLDPEVAQRALHALDRRLPKGLR